MSDILEIHYQLFPHLRVLIDQLRIYYAEKLWKQLSDTLLEYIQDPHVSRDTHLRDLYEGFVRLFYQQIDELKLVRFLIKAADQYGDLNNRIRFLEQFIFGMDQQASLALKLKQAYFLLLQGQIPEVDVLLKRYKQLCDRVVEPLVLSMLYYLAFNFYRIKKNYEEFYVNALQYLAYTPDAEMQLEEKVNLSLEMALAILISPNIYNFSELLQQPLLISLKESQHRWIYQFLETFNKGNVIEFQQLLFQHGSLIQQSQLLNENLNLLQEKIRIMAFLELAFQLPKNNRVCTFQQLSIATQLHIESVEHLVMKTISKGLVKGKINQINQQVVISYVVPRVLSDDKVQVMSKKFSEWDRGLVKFLNEVKQ
ncbi:hypothetical protein pb186bvf_019028 [Paramecium bursaria]